MSEYQTSLLSSDSFILEHSSCNCGTGFQDRKRMRLHCPIPASMTQRRLIRCISPRRAHPLNNVTKRSNWSSHCHRRVSDPRSYSKGFSDRLVTGDSTGKLRQAVCESFWEGTLQAMHRQAKQLISVFLDEVSVASHSPERIEKPSMETVIISCWTCHRFNPPLRSIKADKGQQRRVLGKSMTIWMAMNI